MDEAADVKQPRLIDGCDKHVNVFDYKKSNLKMHISIWNQKDLSSWKLHSWGVVGTGWQQEYLITIKSLNSIQKGDNDIS